MKNANRAMKELARLGAPVVEIRKRREHDPYFMVSGEDENSWEWVDYYGEYRGNYPWVSERLEKVLIKYDLHYEWMNPGTIGVYED